MGIKEIKNFFGIMLPIPINPPKKTPKYLTLKTNGRNNYTIILTNDGQDTIIAAFIDKLEVWQMLSVLTAGYTLGQETQKPPKFSLN